MIVDFSRHNSNLAKKGETNTNGPAAQRAQSPARPSAPQTASTQPHWASVVKQASSTRSHGTQKCPKEISSIRTGAPLPPQHQMRKNSGCAAPLGTEPICSGAVWVRCAFSAARVGPLLGAAHARLYGDTPDTPKTTATTPSAPTLRT